MYLRIYVYVYVYIYICIYIYTLRLVFSTYDNGNLRSLYSLCVCLYALKNKSLLKSWWLLLHRRVIEGTTCNGSPFQSSSLPTLSPLTLITDSRALTDSFTYSLYWLIWIELQIHSCYNYNIQKNFALEFSVKEI